MFYEPSLSVSLPSSLLPSCYCLPSSLASLTLVAQPSPIIYFFSLHPCLSVSLFLQANRHHSVVLVQDEVWMLKRKKKRRRWWRMAHLHPISLHNSTTLWPVSSLTKYIICSHLTFHLMFEILQFVGPGSAFLWWDSLGLTVSCSLSGC